MLYTTTGDHKYEIASSEASIDTGDKSCFVQPEVRLANANDERIKPFFTVDEYAREGRSRKDRLQVIR